MGAGLVAFQRHADFARWAIGAAGSRFVEAGEAAPELDYRLRHHQAAALHAFHRLVSFCPLHEAIPRQWSNTTRTKAAGQQWRCRVWRRRHTKSHDVGGVHRQRVFAALSNTETLAIAAFKGGGRVGDHSVYRLIVRVAFNPHDSGRPKPRADDMRQAAACLA
jgi:hypothetical protein